MISVGNRSQRYSLTTPPELDIASGDLEAVALIDRDQRRLIPKPDPKKLSRTVTAVARRSCWSSLWAAIRFRWVATRRKASRSQRSRVCAARAFVSSARRWNSSAVTAVYIALKTKNSRQRRGRAQLFLILEALGAAAVERQGKLLIRLARKHGCSKHDLVLSE